MSQAQDDERERVTDLNKAEDARRERAARYIEESANREVLVEYEPPARLAPRWRVGWDNNQPE